MDNLPPNHPKYSSFVPLVSVSTAFLPTLFLQLMMKI